MTTDESQPVPQSSKIPFWVWVLLGGVVVVLLLSARSEDPEVKQRIRDTLAVEECWKEHDRKSLDPETKRFIAGSCEKIEKEFAFKHGRKP